MSNIQIKKRSLFDDKVLVQIPDCYQGMEEDKIEAMFPYEDRPQVILSNPDSTRFCTFSYLKEQKLTHSQIIYAIKEMSEIVISLHPLSLLKEPRTMVLPDGDLGWFEYLTADRTGMLHNYMYVFSPDGSMLLGTMGCPLEDEKGKTELKKIMRSIERPKKAFNIRGVKR